MEYGQGSTFGGEVYDYLVKKSAAACEPGCEPVSGRTGVLFKSSSTPIVETVDYLGLQA